MTREEHISNLKTIGCDGWTVTTEAYKSLQFAIKALEQEPSGDLISRQAVLNTLDRMDKALDTDRTVESYKELLTECYKALPPVKQEPKTGRWVDDKCSICGKGIEDLIDSREWYKNETPNYCPFCGKRVVESEEI